LRPGGPPGTVSKQVGVHNIVPQVRTALLTQGSDHRKARRRDSGRHRRHRRPGPPVWHRQAGEGQPRRAAGQRRDGRARPARRDHRGPVRVPHPLQGSGPPRWDRHRRPFPASGDSGCGNGMELVAGGGTTAIW